MQIFLDTAEVSEVSDRIGTGLIDGVTTNPTLIRKSGRQPEAVYQELIALGVQDISMEVMGTTEAMVDQGMLLGVKYGPKATIKLPCTKDGLQACKELTEQGFRTNVTLVFCASQAILAAKAGATYVSPFVGRLDDQSVAGLEVVRSISELYRIHGMKTKVLAASIRSIQRVVRSFYNGAEIVTMPPSIFDKMYDHILTDAGMDIFDRDGAGLL